MFPTYNSIPAPAVYVGFQVQPLRGLLPSTAYVFSFTKYEAGAVPQPCQHLDWTDAAGTLSLSYTYNLNANFSNPGIYLAIMSVYTASACPSGSTPGTTAAVVAQGAASVRVSLSARPLPPLKSSLLLPHSSTL